MLVFATAHKWQLQVAVQVKFGPRLLFPQINVYPKVHYLRSLKDAPSFSDQRPTSSRPFVLESVLYTELHRNHGPVVSSSRGKHCRRITALHRHSVANLSTGMASQKSMCCDEPRLRKY